MFLTKNKHFPLPLGEGKKQVKKNTLVASSKIKASLVFFSKQTTQTLYQLFKGKKGDKEIRLSVVLRKGNYFSLRNTFLQQPTPSEQRSFNFLQEPVWISNCLFRYRHRFLCACYFSHKTTVLAKKGFFLPIGLTSCS